jgi:hypothetical protein
VVGSPRPRPARARRGAPSAGPATSVQPAVAPAAPGLIIHMDLPRFVRAMTRDGPAATAAPRRCAGARRSARCMCAQSRAPAQPGGGGGAGRAPDALRATRLARQHRAPLQLAPRSARDSRGHNCALRSGEHRCPRPSRASRLQLTSPDSQVERAAMGQSFESMMDEEMEFEEGGEFEEEEAVPAVVVRGRRSQPTGCSIRAGRGRVLDGPSPRRLLAPGSRRPELQPTRSLAPAGGRVAAHLQPRPVRRDCRRAGGSRHHCAVPHPGAGAALPCLPCSALLPLPAAGAAGAAPAAPPPLQQHRSPSSLHHLTAPCTPRHACLPPPPHPPTPQPSHRARPLQVFQPIQEGRDLIGRAKTGSGKTLAFALPVIENLLAVRGWLAGCPAAGRLAGRLAGRSVSRTLQPPAAGAGRVPSAAQHRGGLLPRTGRALPPPPPSSPAPQPPTDSPPLPLMAHAGEPHAGPGARRAQPPAALHRAGAHA